MFQVFRLVGSSPAHFPRVHSSVLVISSLGFRVQGRRSADPRTLKETSHPEIEAYTFRHKGCTTSQSRCPCSLRYVALT